MRTAAAHTYAETNYANLATTRHEKATPARWALLLGPIRCSLSSKRAACQMYPLPLTFFALKTPKTVDRRRRWMHRGFPGATGRGNFLER